MGEGGACRRMRQNTTVGLWRRQSRQNEQEVTASPEQLRAEREAAERFFRRHPLLKGG